MKLKRQITLWMEQRWMAASLIPLGVDELISSLGLHRILTSQDFWQDWVFEEFLLKNLSNLLNGLFTHFV